MTESTPRSVVRKLTHTDPAEAARRIIDLEAEVARLVEAGERLRIMLHSQMVTSGYGTPEHEDRCREALKGWSKALEGDSG